MQHPVQTASRFYQHQTPPEYYSQARPAGFSPDSETPNLLKGGNREEVENTFPEHKSERLNVALIGVLAGLVTVAGVVVPLVVLNK